MNRTARCASSVECGHDLENAQVMMKARDLDDKVAVPFDNFLASVQAELANARMTLRKGSPNEPSQLLYGHQ